MVVQPASVSLPTGVQSGHFGPERCPVVWVQQVRCLVGDQVIDNTLRCQHDQPVVLYATGSGAVPPFGFGTAQADIGQAIFPAFSQHQLPGFFKQIILGLGFIKVGQYVVNVGFVQHRCDQRQPVLLTAPLRPCAALETQR